MLLPPEKLLENAVGDRNSRRSAAAPRAVLCAALRAAMRATSCAVLGVALRDTNGAQHPFTHRAQPLYHTTGALRLCARRVWSCARSPSDPPISPPFTAMASAVAAVHGGQNFFFWLKLITIISQIKKIKNLQVS